MIAAPEGENNVHLEVLARLSIMLMNEDFKKSLINAENKEEFLNLIDIKENDKINEENKHNWSTSYRLFDRNVGFRNIKEKNSIIIKVPQ